MKLQDYCTVEVVEMDEKFTTEAIKMNKGNRSVNSSRVKTYAEDMKRGYWKFNGEPLIFTTDGRLINGQLRVLAHKESGYVKGVLTLVVRLLRDEGNEAFGSLDSGLKRTYAQILSIGGVPNYTSMAAIRRAIGKYIRNEGNAPSNAAMDSIGKHYADVIGVLAKESAFKNFGTEQVKAAMVVCAKATGSVGKVMDFINRISVGANLEEGSPELALKNFMFNYRAMSGTAAEVKFAVACKCFLNSMSGTKMAFARLTKDGIAMVKKVAEQNGVAL